MSSSALDPTVGDPARQPGLGLGPTGSKKSVTIEALQARPLDGHRHQNPAAISSRACARALGTSVLRDVLPHNKTTTPAQVHQRKRGIEQPARRCFVENRQSNCRRGRPNCARGRTRRPPCSRPTRHRAELLHQPVRTCPAPPAVPTTRQAGILAICPTIELDRAGGGRDQPRISGLGRPTSAGRNRP